MRFASPVRCFLLASLSALALTGCAKYPDNSGSQTGKQIIVTLRVRGQIQPADSPVPYYYFVLLNRTDSATAAGPVPVVDRPWGNGFAAPAQQDSQGFNAFVRYDRFQAQRYGVYRVEGNPVNGAFVPLGAPDAFTVPQTGESTLTFRLDLGRLPNPDAPYVQVNLLATNNIPVGSEDAAKSWDALGDGRDTGTINNWLTIPIGQNGIYRNSDTNLEPSGDVREKLGATVEEPNLDIVDWTIEIRSR